MRVDHAGLGDAAQPPRSDSGHGHGHGRAAVVGVPERDDLARPGVTAGGEDCGFVGFGAAVGEEGLGQLSARGDSGQLLRQRRLRLISEDRGDVLHGLQLLHDLPGYGRVGMADADGHDAAEEIQILVAVGIPDELVPGARQHQGSLVVVKHRGEDVLLLREYDFIFGHTVRTSFLQVSAPWLECSARPGRAGSNTKAL